MLVQEKITTPLSFPESPSVQPAAPASADNNPHPGFVLERYTIDGRPVLLKTLTQNA
jgi:hypothetical protein